MEAQPAPAIYTDRARQIRGMISFHRRAERAYRAAGNYKAMGTARKSAEVLEAELSRLEAQTRKDK